MLELFEKLSVEEKNFVVGGGEIFAELLPYAEEIILTEVATEKVADTFFPKFGSEFSLVNEKTFPDFSIKNFLKTCQ